MSKIAFLGLGVMGAPMAGHLARAGHRVTVFNRTVARAEAWLARHDALAVTLATTPAEAAAGQDAVLTCVGNDADLAQVLLGADGALAAMEPGALLVDHTTVSPATARRICAEASARGVMALDAPVSGGQAGAEAGQLSIMCGGTAAALDRSRPMLETYAARIAMSGMPALARRPRRSISCASRAPWHAAGVLIRLVEGLAFEQHIAADALGCITFTVGVVRGITMVTGTPRRVP